MWSVWKGSVAGTVPATKAASAGSASEDAFAFRRAIPRFKRVCWQLSCLKSCH